MKRGGFRIKEVDARVRKKVLCRCGRGRVKNEMFFSGMYIIKTSSVVLCRFLFAKMKNCERFERLV